MEPIDWALIAILIGILQDKVVNVDGSALGLVNIHQ